MLLIEQFPGSLSSIQEALPEFPPHVLPFAQGEAAPDLISREKITVVFCDLAGGDPRGQTLIRQILRIHGHLPILAVVDQGAHAIALDAFRHGAADVLFRPLSAGDISLALERACDLRVRRSERSQMQRQAARSLDDLLLLKAVGATTGSEENLQRLCERVVEAIQSALQVDIVSLMLRNEAGQLEIHAARGLPPEVVASVRVSPGEGVAGHVLATGEAVLIDNLAGDGRFGGSGATARYRSGSVLSVPMSAQDRVVGVLNVNNKHDREHFTAADRDVLTMIARQAALAIENLKLVGRLREQSSELETTHAELLRLHRDRTRFVCSLSHELKTPLTSILGFADLLTQFFDQLKDEEVREHLGRIYSSGCHLEKLITGMLRLFSLDSEREHWDWQAEPLLPCLETVLDDHAGELDEQGLSVELLLPADLAPLRADREKLLLLLDALIDNAIKFNRFGGSVQIRAENRQVDGRALIYLAIANDGRSVPPEQAAIIFQHYSQLGDLDTDKPSGVGIGLATCRAILRQMHGEIFLEPPGGEGTCLGLLLPAYDQHEEADHDDARHP